MSKANPMELLTARQAEAASLFHAGFTNGCIAEMLDINRRAVLRLRQRSRIRLGKRGVVMPAPQFEPRVAERIRVVQGSDMIAFN